MNNNYKTRKEKVELLTGILLGRKTVEDLERTAQTEITVWQQDDAGNWQSEEHAMTKEQMKKGEYPASSRTHPRINIVIIQPLKDEE